MFKVDISNDLHKLRLDLNYVFAPDTTLSWDPNKPSRGHCAAVALIVHRQFGGKLVSTMEEGVSHWYNQIEDIDADLTGDQFGHPYGLRVLTHPRHLYAEFKVRELSEVNLDTWVRSHKLEHRVAEYRRAQLPY